MLETKSNRPAQKDSVYSKTVANVLINGSCISNGLAYLEAGLVVAKLKGSSLGKAWLF